MWASALLLAQSSRSHDSLHPHSWKEPVPVTATDQGLPLYGADWEGDTARRCSGWARPTEILAGLAAPWHSGEVWSVSAPWAYFDRWGTRGGKETSLQVSALFLPNYLEIKRLCAASLVTGEPVVFAAMRGQLCMQHIVCVPLPSLLHSPSALTLAALGLHPQ